MGKCWDDINIPISSISRRSMTEDSSGRGAILKAALRNHRDLGSWIPWCRRWITKSSQKKKQRYSGWWFQPPKKCVGNWRSSNLLQIISNFYGWISNVFEPTSMSCPANPRRRDCSTRWWPVVQSLPRGKLVRPVANLLFARQPARAWKRGGGHCVSGNDTGVGLSSGRVNRMRPAHFSKCASLCRGHRKGRPRVRPSVGS